MSDPRSTTWQIPYFVEDDWETAIQEIAKIREFVREELQKDKKYQTILGAHLDLFNSVRTPHEYQSGGNASERIRGALQTHQKGVWNLMSKGKRIWNLWSEWKEQVWEEYKERYSRRTSPFSRHDPLHNEWTRVCMNGYTFSSASDFAEFSFPKKTSFDEAIFSSKANFRGASFQKVSFDGVTFSGDADFRGTAFARHPSFVSATFSKDFQFDTGMKYFLFDSETKYFRLKHILKKLLSMGVSTLQDDFDSKSFHIEADFTNATFSQEVNFYELSFRGYAKFSGATFKGGVNFSDTDFRMTANFAGAMFPQKAEFSRSTFKDEANFENAVFSSETSFINTKFEHPPVFHGAKLHPSTAFAPGLELWNQFKNLGNEGARDRFRTLKNHFKNQEAQFEANLFYALEMRATRREEVKAWKLGRAALIFVFDECTAFGLSVFRPLAWWLAVQILLTITLVWFSPVSLTPINSVMSSLSLAFLNSFSLPGLVDSNLFASQIATVFQIEQPSVYATMLELSRRFPMIPFALGLAKVFSAAFIFLTLLALRNRFRIK